MFILGGGARNLSALAAARGWSFAPDLAAVMPLPGFTLDGTVLRLAVPEASHLGAAVAAAAGVTAARLALLAAWPSFRDESEAANEQTLPALSLADVMLVALVTGVSEARRDRHACGLTREGHACVALL